MILADRLLKVLNSVAVYQYEVAYTARLKTLPIRPCVVCVGLGHHADEILGLGTIPCKECNGTGMIPQFETHYPFSTDTVRRFEAFLRHCGGFRIY